MAETTDRDDADVDLFNIWRPSGCGSGFTLQLKGWDETNRSAFHDVDLSVTQGDANTIGTTGTYNNTQNSTATFEQITINDSTANIMYAVRVSQKATGTNYELDYFDSCGSTNPPPPNDGLGVGDLPHLGLVH